MAKQTHMLEQIQWWLRVKDKTIPLRWLVTICLKVMHTKSSSSLKILKFSNHSPLTSVISSTKLDSSKKHTCRTRITSKLYQGNYNSHNPNLWTNTANLNLSSPHSSNISYHRQSKWRTKPTHFKSLSLSQKCQTLKMIKLRVIKECTNSSHKLLKETWPLRKKKVRFQWHSIPKHRVLKLSLKINHLQAEASENNLRRWTGHLCLIQECSQRQGLLS